MTTASGTNEEAPPSREVMALEEIAAQLRGMRADLAGLTAAVRGISRELGNSATARYGVIRGESEMPPEALVP